MSDRVTIFIADSPGFEMMDRVRGAVNRSAAIKKALDYLFQEENWSRDFLGTKTEAQSVG